MKTGKIILVKETCLNNDVWYIVNDESGYCLGCSRDYDVANDIYNMCVSNKENGLPTLEIIKQH